MFKILIRVLLILALVIGGVIIEYHYSEAGKAAAELEIATQRVESNLAKGKHVLKLSDLRHLRELPENISRQPKWLQIDLNNTNISDIARLAELEELNRLSIRNTRVHDLLPLNQKAAIQSLDIGNTLIHDLSPIAAMENLERLDIGSNSLQSLEPVTRASRLNWLNLHNAHAHDGSKNYLETLQKRPGMEIYNGNAFKQNYVPGVMYRSCLTFKTLWRKWELDRMYQRIVQ
ncbi:MAG: hypothetical protein QNJ29_12555 [Rhizobiaceae bacterium]|nr:hypothetical protein [Rhizobiaceae bacterium]